MALFYNKDGKQYGFGLCPYEITPAIISRIRQCPLTLRVIAFLNTQFCEAAKQFEIENAEWDAKAQSIKITDCDTKKITQINSKGVLDNLNKIHIIGKCHNNYITLSYRAQLITNGLVAMESDLCRLPIIMEIHNEKTIQEYAKLGNALNIKLVTKDGKSYISSIKGIIPNYSFGNPNTRVIDELANTTKAKSLKRLLDHNIGNNEEDKKQEFNRELYDARYLGKTLFGNSMDILLKISLCKKYIKSLEVDGTNSYLGMRVLFSGQVTKFRRLVNNISAGRVGAKTRRHYKLTLKAIKDKRVQLGAVKKFMDSEWANILSRYGRKRFVEYYTTSTLLNVLKLYKEYLLDYLTYNKVVLSHAQLKPLVQFLETNQEAHEYIVENIDGFSTEAIKTGIKNTLNCRIDSVSTALLMASMEIVGMLKLAEQSPYIAHKIYNVILWGAVILKEPIEIESEEDYGYLIWQAVVLGVQKVIHQYL